MDTVITVSTIVYALGGLLVAGVCIAVPLILLYFIAEGFKH